MNLHFLVVATTRSATNKFGEPSLQAALNLRDFLEQTGEYLNVSILQQSTSGDRPMEWVVLKDVER